MIEIYSGTGAGKTSAAVGRAVRAAGHGIPVLFVQFLKDGKSGEIASLKKLDGVQVETCEDFFGFVIDMSDEQIAKTREGYDKILRKIDAFCSQERGEEKLRGVVVIDEALHACRSDLLDRSELAELLKRYRDRYEFILTGSVEDKELFEIADYVTLLSNYKHPYQFGIQARKGIEF